MHFPLLPASDLAGMACRRNVVVRHPINNVLEMHMPEWRTAAAFHAAHAAILGARGSQVASRLMQAGRTRAE
jgi:hypothetical protein